MSPITSAFGTFRTCRDVRLESVMRTKADSVDYYRFMGSRPLVRGERIHSRKSYELRAG
jgi:hypothetical protein